MNAKAGVSRARARNVLVVVALALNWGVQLAAAGSGDARSTTHRIISGSATSVAGSSTSPAHQLYLVGGSGAAVGIAASANTSIVAGNTTIEPPERLFRGDFEVLNP